jgi:transcription elongation factor
MSSVSKSIFVLEEKSSELLYDYISLMFTDKKLYKNTKSKQSFFECLMCCEIFEMPYESVVSYANIYNNEDKIDKFTQWIIDISKKYLSNSFINSDNLSVYIIECINNKDNKILIENANTATVIFHFNDNKNGYVTTHESNLNFLTNDRKYIIVTFK